MLPNGQGRVPVPWSARASAVSFGEEMMHRRILPVLAAVLLAAIGTTACLGGEDEPDSTRNADAKEFTLTIAANAIAGGKNAAERRLDRELGDPQVHRGPEGQGASPRRSSSSPPASTTRSTRPRSPSTCAPAAAPTCTPSTASGSASSPTPATSSRWTTWSAPTPSTRGTAGRQIPKPVQGNCHVQGQALRRPGGHRRPGPLLQQEAVRAGRPARATGSRSRWDEILAAGTGLKASRRA